MHPTKWRESMKNNEKQNRILEIRPTVASVCFRRVATTAIPHAVHSRVLQEIKRFYQLLSLASPSAPLIHVALCSSKPSRYMNVHIDPVRDLRQVDSHTHSHALVCFWGKKTITKTTPKNQTP
jgi:ribosomal protein L32E